MVNHNISLVKNFIESNLSHFKILSENSYSMFWEIIFAYNDLEVKLSGDVSGFSTSIFIDSKEYPIWQYDRSVINAMKTNDENILYQLKIVKKFILEINESPT